MTDFRALCAELAELCKPVAALDLLVERMNRIYALADRARAALAAEETGPRDGGRSVADYMQSEIDVVESCAGFTDESTPVGEAWSRILRAMQVSRYRSATPRPIPVEERLPGAGDCDAEGYCWTTDHDPSLVYRPVWKMTELPRKELGHDFSNAYFWRNVRYWLPAHALPLPAATKENI